jgi:hypothetical protein
LVRRCLKRLEEKDLDRLHDGNKSDPAGQDYRDVESLECDI